jgi:hypothetical protein
MINTMAGLVCFIVLNSQRWFIMVEPAYGIYLTSPDRHKCAGRHILHGARPAHLCRVQFSLQNIVFYFVLKNYLRIQTRYTMLTFFRNNRYDRTIFIYYKPFGTFTAEIRWLRHDNCVSTESAEPAPLAS